MSGRGQPRLPSGQTTDRASRTMMAARSTWRRRTRSSMAAFTRGRIAGSTDVEPPLDVFVDGRAGADGVAIGVFVDRHAPSIVAAVKTDTIRPAIMTSSYSARLC